MQPQTEMTQVEKLSMAMLARNLFFIGGTDSIYKAYKKGLYKPEIWYVYVAP
jgi:hypothetical protein